MNYFRMSNKELSQTIRNALKEAGFASKDYSIRVRDGGYNKSVHITIKNPLVRLSDIEAVGKRFEEVERDERSYEILQGCNVFVLCQYAYGIFEDAAAPLVSIAETVFNNEKWNGRKIAQNDKTEVHFIQINENEGQLYEFDREKTQHNAISSYTVRCAEALAVAMWRYKNLGTIYA